MLNDIKGIVKTEIQNRKAVYKALKMDKVPDGGKVLLAFLGHPRFINMFKKDHPSSQVIVLDSEDLNWLFDESQKEVILVNPVNINQIKENLKNMKFDYVIMNPPYNGNLHLKILEEVMKHSDNIINLSPNIFAPYRCGTSAYEMRSIFKNRLDTLEVLDHRTSNDLFGLGNQISELAIYNIKKEGKADIDTLGFSSKEEASLYQKIYSKIPGKLNWENKNTQRHGKMNDNSIAIYRWHIGKDAYDTCIDNTGKATVVLYLDTPEQVKNFKDSLRTDFMEFVIRTTVWPGKGATEKCFMFDKDLYNEPWTNERFYRFFKLTPDEIKIIEDTSKNYK